MQTQIGTASILAFIPTVYPAGFVLAERYDPKYFGIKVFTAEVDDINESTRLLRRHDSHTSAMARDEMVERFVAWRAEHSWQSNITNLA